MNTRHATAHPMASPVATSITTWALLSTLTLLSACGGGGGSDTEPPPTEPTSPPASGTYGWILKAEGPTANLKYGLSLLHPEAAATEYVVEVASDAVTDAKAVSSGTVNASALTVTAMQPYALVYIVGGDVRRVPLAANGVAPRTRVQRAGSTSACNFVIDAVDYAAPEQSRFVVSTAGADGACATADDGSAEVRLEAGNAGIVVTPLAGPAPLAALRDPSTLAPRGWLFPTQVTWWSPSPGSSLTVRPAANPVTRVVSSTYRAALVESAAGLSLIDFTGGDTFVDTPLATVAPAGWQTIGHDSQFHYIYRNSAERAGDWQVLRVSRSTPVASTLASGSGSIAVAALGKDRLFLTVFGPTSNQLLRLQKAVPGAAAQVLEDTAQTTLSTVITSATDVHQLWRVTGVGTATPGYALEMIDETGAKLFSTTGGGFPLLLSGGSGIDFNTSETRTRFVFADKYGARAFGDATLMAYDTVSRTATSAGALPGSADFGGDFVVANVSGGPSSFMTGFAARSINGVVQSAGTKVFSFDAGTSTSLKFTAGQQ